MNMDANSRGEVKFLETIAAANRTLSAFAKEIATRPEVKEVSKWPFTCWSYSDAVSLEGNVVPELHDGNALDFGAELSRDDRRWIMVSACAA